VRIWDARPWTPQAAIEREAIGLLDFLFGLPLCRADVREHLSTLETIRPEARQLALTLAERYHEETEPERYRAAAWTLTRQPYLNPVQYRYALLQAQHACRQAPQQGQYRTMLGIAQYRAGQYEQALATLTQAEALHPVAVAGLALSPMSSSHALAALWQADQLRQTLPAHYAFLAMTRHRLDQPGPARAALDRLRELLRQPGWADDDDAPRLLHETEEVLRGPVHPVEP
jgi:tetratricopeptide (TPR) repeat protein